MSAEIPRGTASCEQMDPASVDQYFFEAPLRNSRKEIEWARRICLGCAALEACRDYALTENPKYGVLAGMTPAERDRLVNGGDAA